MSQLKKRKNKKIILYFICIGLFIIPLFLALIFTKAPSKTTTYTITRTDDGFVPDTLSIKLGDTVIFKSKRNDFFWPASDFHPSHTLYPEFDPKEPVKGDSSWKFTFNKEGTWRFHDHLSPGFTGVITVGEKSINGNSKTYDLSKNCKDVKTAEKEKCWEELFDASLQKGGIENAFSVFEDLYETEPTFLTRGCHWYAHKIGAEAYRQFAKGSKFVLTEQTSYCGYGFYHGFMELLLREDQDIKKAKRFCDYVDQELKDKAPGTRINCYHGIGHGLIEDPPHPSTWGNVSAMTEPVLKICDKISDRPIEVKECGEGAFNAVVLFMVDNKYGLSFDKDDPMAICRKQTSVQHERECYYELSQKLTMSIDSKIQNITDFTDSISDDYIAKMITNVVAAGIIQNEIARDDFSSFVTECRSLGERLRLSCISGVAGGIIAHGDPGKEYIKGTQFCAESILSKDEKEACYQTMSDRFRLIYDKKKRSSICNSIPSEYQSICNDN